MHVTLGFTPNALVLKKIFEGNSFIAWNAPMKRKTLYTIKIASIIIFIAS